MVWTGSHTFAWRYWGQQRRSCVWTAGNVSVIPTLLNWASEACVKQKLQMHGVLPLASHLSPFPLLSDAIGFSTIHGRMWGYMNWMGFGMRQSWPSEGTHYPSIWQDRLKKTTKRPQSGWLVLGPAVLRQSQPVRCLQRSGFRMDVRGKDTTMLHNVLKSCAIRALRKEFLVHFRTVCQNVSCTTDMAFVQSETCSHWPCGPVVKTAAL
jgi:hypothetical protein